MAKNNTGKAKRQTTNWKKTCAPYNTAEGLIAQLYKELLDCGVIKIFKSNRQHTRTDNSQKGVKNDP